MVTINEVSYEALLNNIRNVIEHEGAMCTSPSETLKLAEIITANLREDYHIYSVIKFGTEKSPTEINKHEQI